MGSTAVQLVWVRGISVVWGALCALVGDDGAETSWRERFGAFLGMSAITFIGGTFLVY